MKGKLMIIAVAAVTAIITYAITKSVTSGPAAAVGLETGMPEEKLQIEGLKVEPAAIGESWDVIATTGKIGPNVNQVVKIGPRIAGKVVAVNVQIGDTVARGQALAVISSTELAQARAAYRQAAARLSAAEQAYENQTRLAKLGAFASRPVEEARSEHLAAQSELSQAESELAQNQSELVRVESELAVCQARLARARELYKDQIVSKQDLEAAEGEHERDLAEVEAVKSKIGQTRSRIGQLKSRVDIAAKYLDREQKVLGGNLLSNRELQAAKREVTEAKLDHQAAADAIRVLGASPGGFGETLAITSPISGRVIERNVSLGEMVEPSSVLFTVMNLSDVWVEASVYERDLAKIHTGQTAEIRVGSYPDKVFHGTVMHIGDVLDAASRTAKVRCAVSNPDGTLKPEMFATVNIITAKRGSAVLIAKQAVLDESGGKIVFVTCADCPEDRKAGKSVCGEFDKRRVALGPAHGGKIEVIKGIESGEEVVTQGQYQLKMALGSGKLEAGCADEK